MLVAECDECELWLLWLEPWPQPLAAGWTGPNLILLLGMRVLSGRHASARPVGLLSTKGCPPRNEWPRRWTGVAAPPRQEPTMSRAPACSWTCTRRQAAWMGARKAGGERYFSALL